MACAASRCGRARHPDRRERPRDGGIIECPQHNGRFDHRTGKAIGAPMIGDIETYPVRVEDGTVYLQLG
jgi:nitrite reductase/ring-hydroxylating ferredoxin subunit